MKKLKSRKFWICVALAGYGAIMGIRALNVENEAVTVVCIIAAIAVGIGYIFAEALVDSDSALEEEFIEENDEEAAG